MNFVPWIKVHDRGLSESCDEFALAETFSKFIVAARDEGCIVQSLDVFYRIFNLWITV